MKKDVIRMTDKAWSGNMWSRIRAILTGHESRIDALEQGGGGGGGAVSGVKGDAESTYRTGNVNLTPANIGALPSSTTFVSGVKGNAESSYRSGNVNLTPANIGALALTGGSVSGNLGIRKSEVDGTEDDNGLESNLYPGLTVSDKNSEWLATFRTFIYTNGRIGVGMSLRNYVNSAWSEQTAFAFFYDKNGSISYSIIAAPFRKALGLGDASGNLPVNVDQGGTGAIDAATARTNLKAAYALGFLTADDTWAEVWAKLDDLPIGQGISYYAAANAASVLTGSKVSSTLRGVVSRASSSQFDFNGTAGYNDVMYGWRITAATSSGCTVGTVYKYTGTAI